MPDRIENDMRRAYDKAPEMIPEGMTQDQLEFFTFQTQRAVTHRLRLYRRSALAGFLVLFIGIMLALFETGRQGDESRQAVVNSGKAVAVEGCNRDFERDVKFRNLLERLKDAARANKTATAEQKKVAIMFYDSQLKQFRLPDCRKSEALLTDNPDQRIPEVAPYYPGGPNVAPGKRLPQDAG